MATASGSSSAKLKMLKSGRMFELERLPELCAKARVVGRLLCTKMASLPPFQATYPSLLCHDLEEVRVSDLTTQCSF